MDEVAAYLTDGLPQLLDLLGESDVRELELQDGEMHVRVHRLPAEPGQVSSRDVLESDVVRPEPPRLTQVTAPLVGTFYRAPNPGQAPLVTEGSRVEGNTIVGIIEALQVLTDVDAGCTGIVASVLATDGQPVEYGQPLLEVRTSA